MFIGFVPFPATADAAGVHCCPRSAIHARAVATGRPWPLREVGTGGVAVGLFIRDAFGYQPVTVLEPTPVVPEAPYAGLMRQVKAGFGRTMSRLPEVFGVSRQTLYNWLEGETPRPAYHERLRQLAEAALVLRELGIKPTTPMLDRTVAQGKTFLQLLADGADGRETATKLVRIVQRGNASQAKLDELLGGRRAKLSGSDIGAPSLDETA